MSPSKAKSLSKSDQETLLHLLQTRFEKNMHRHGGLSWNSVLKKLNGQADKLWSLSAMEETGGEPDVVALDSKKNEVVFYDCSAESPSGRRSLCYDIAALNDRKEHKPSGDALSAARQIGVEVLSETDYRYLQQAGPFDQKTSSWLLTPPAIRSLGGAIFGDYRYGQVFIYHNGASSYYAARGFRTKIVL
jgi:hypothetical protein